MAKISEYPPSTTPLTGSEVVLGNQGNVTKLMNVQAIANLTDLSGLLNETSHDQLSHAGLPGIPTTLPASDVSPWAKDVAKPVYTAVEVGALPNTTTAGTIPVTPAGNIASTNVQAALVELDGEKMAAVTPGTSGNLLVSNGSGWVSSAAGSAEVVVVLGDVSGTQELNMALGSILTATATGNTAFTVTNPQVGKTGITLIITNGGLTGQTFFSANSVACQFPGGYIPTLTPTGTDRLEFFTIDNWATMSGGVSGRDVK